MEEQVASLEQYFQRCEVQNLADTNAEDMMLSDGEFWEFKDPDKVEGWSFQIILFKNDLSFSYKFKNSTVYLQLSFEEKVKDVEADAHPVIKIKCMTMVPEIPRDQQYHFMIVLDSMLIPFSLTPFLKSLETSIFVDEVKELQKKLDNNDWHNKDGTSINCRRLVAKLRFMFSDLSTLKGKLDLQNKLKKARSVSLNTGTPGGSEISKRNSNIESGSGRGKRSTQKPPKPSIQKQRKKSGASASNQVMPTKATEGSEVVEGSYVDEMQNVPHSRKTEKKMDFKSVSEVYQRFWTSCKDAYVLPVGQKKEIDMSKLIAAPSTFNIRSKENRIVEDMVTWLLNILDKTNKQTLCVMPVGHTEKPATWEAIQEGQFYIINGQHSVEASKWMLDNANGITEEMKNHFRKWNCFIVYSADVEKLRNISAYYNRTNHFVATQPSWATNILGARSVWLAMDRPRNLKEVYSVGTTSSTRRTVENICNRDKFNEFKKAVYIRFLMIDVNKNLKLSKTKDKEEKLKLTNEPKLITAPDDVYNLWKDIITASAHGELFNPDTEKLFNTQTDWNPDNCILSREFFKFLGNLSYEELAKLANHILNQTGKGQKHCYPKVTIKAITSVLDSCYTTKECAERRKRKHLVKKELHQINHELGLLNAKNEIIVENWKAFKKDRMFSRATMDVLLDRPGERYFSEAKLVRSRNKTCAHLSNEAFVFFQVFLEQKTKFVKPTATGHYRTYDDNMNRLSDWPSGAWKVETAKRMGLGVIDFCTVPRISKKEKSTMDNPYFVEVLSSIFKKEPKVEDLCTWLFICADEKEQAQVLRYIETNKVLETYDIAYADYYAGKNDRLGDLTAARTPKKFSLMFLQNPINAMKIDIPEEFHCPEIARYLKARSYSELEYRLNNLELRMEFYLWLMRTFCNPGMSVFLGFAGGKLTCAAIMSCVDVYASGPLENSSWWEEIWTKAMTLDKSDFFDNAYKILSLDAALGSQSEPSSSKRKLRSSNDSLEGQRKRKPVLIFDDHEDMSEEEEEEEDDDEVDGDGGLDQRYLP